MHLPANWTQIDQEIIEALLLDQPAGVVRSDESNAQQILRYRALLARQITSETRKSKHRAVQRRFMQRKKDQIHKVKQQVERLEKEYELLQAAWEKKQLKRENNTLTEDIDKCEPLPFPTQEQIDLLLSDQQKLIRESYTPLTASDWDELLRNNLLEFEASSCETGYESTGAVVLGWSDRRKIDFDKGTTRFVMTKRFAHLNAQDFYETTYDKLCKPEAHPELFHPAVTIRMQHLQEINKGGVVLHRCMFNPQTGGAVHTIETMMRVQHGRSQIIFLRTLEYNPAYDCLPKTHHWLQLFTALVFTPSQSSGRRVTGNDGDREPGCIFRYAGCLRDLPPEAVKYWLMEMLYVILRFESVMVAPVFALRAE
ncbi:hypothetical protein JG687_00014968 [Phytophthora cactorum]|uniref:BZIP domain-containing protein n=1 Tax=Phytophthora cactorum TaxID=29920 RepID=A0A8T1TZA7_9STRA|nr:hypothetical protein PC120_g21323 [Phytophthora cactorum]KAG3059267.1 hypothetical protein PC121_g14008 [Phytophthora cactorum]KAG3161171.1 hypothetical protein PC128_g20853 [Phytophthora cactorum]KAG4042721.1 hypothetical protein PC123_g21796 [Phytophthora cactorum]KAG6949296.1 hypothetical protein JG687_00014968 [Phytophthora cactorum]